MAVEDVKKVLRQKIRTYFSRERFPGIALHALIALPRLSVVTLEIILFDSTYLLVTDLPTDFTT